MFPGTYYYVDDVSLTCIQPGGCNVGIDEISKNDISVYPHPFENLFTIQIKDSKISEWKLRDLLGREILACLENDKQSIKVDANSLTTGIYLLKIKLKNGLVLGRKVAKH